MASKRMGRINEDIQRELSALIRRMKDPRINGVVSVTDVETSSDLHYAKVYISVANKEESDQVFAGLKSASGWLRKELGQTLSLRYTPELQFVRDDSIDRGSHILEMLRDPTVVKPPNPANEDIHLDDEG